MSNPWLEIPLSDYEGHMASPEVCQLDALADLFAEALAIVRPESVAVLGVAGGNGLDRIDPAITHRVAGFDINPGYLAEVRRRHPRPGGLELVCADLAAGPLNGCEPVALVHAALVFEHAGIGCCLDNALSLVAPDGALSVVLQLPGEAEPGVGRSGYPSIQRLKDHFVFIDPDGLRETLVKRQFQLAHESTRLVAGGKSFRLEIFRRLPSSGSSVL